MTTVTNITNENFVVLAELLRRARELISPIKYSDEIKYLMSRDVANKYYEKNPKCFLSLQTKGRDNILFPVCNRSGAEDLKFISFSLKLARRLRDKVSNVADVDVIITKLERLEKKYSKEVPKPINMATKKAKTTRTLNSIKDYLRNKINND